MNISSASAVRALPHRLSAGELAFVRSWAEGLEVSAAWLRYLRPDNAVDARVARRELRRLRDELGSRARALGRPDIAALLRRDPEAMAPASTDLPTLEAFRATLPADLYSEGELLALYRERYGADDARSPARRRQRLRLRLVEALAWLETQEARPPQRCDAVADWLDEHLAARLARAGIADLGALIEHVAQHGARWHRGVPRLGAVGAARLLGWLRGHEASLGPLPLPAPKRPAGPLPVITGLVPLERWSPPQALDGSAGQRRAVSGDCRISARNDLEAVQAWLALWPTGSHTWRAYRKEAERLLLWAVLVRGRALSSLEPPDLEAFEAFLAAPPPDWIGPRNVARWSEAWRPLEGPLAPRSRARALAASRSLLGWLVAQGYLAADAAPAPSPRLAGHRPRREVRALPPALWARVLDWVEQQPAGPSQRRLRWVLRLAHGTGMRLSELVAATSDWLVVKRAGRRSAWSIRVERPGLAPRELPLSRAVVESFREVLTDRGLAFGKTSSEHAVPLIARLDGRGPLSASRLYEELATAFRRCAGELLHDDPHGAERVRRASAHWLRHGHGLEQAASGVRPRALQRSLGHRQPGSVSIYYGGRAIGTQAAASV